MESMTVWKDRSNWIEIALTNKTWAIGLGGRVRCG